MSKHRCGRFVSFRRVWGYLGIKSGFGYEHLQRRNPKPPIRDPTDGAVAAVCSCGLAGATEAHPSSVVTPRGSGPGAVPAPCAWYPQPRAGKSPCVKSATLGLVPLGVQLGLSCSLHVAFLSAFPLSRLKVKVLCD